MYRQFYAALCCLLVYSQVSYSYPCELILQKNSCWLDYEVTVYMEHITQGKVRKIAVLPPKKAQKKIKFTCQPHQKITFIAKPYPSIWEGQEEERYKAKKIWTTPPKLAPNVSSWRIKLCFPDQFLHVPSPLMEAPHTCRCLKEDQ